MPTVYPTPTIVVNSRCIPGPAIPGPLRTRCQFPLSPPDLAGPMRADMADRTSRTPLRGGRPVPLCPVVDLVHLAGTGARQSGGPQRRERRLCASSRRWGPGRRRRSASPGRAPGITRHPRTGMCAWLPQRPADGREPRSARSGVRVCPHHRARCSVGRIFYPGSHPVRYLAGCACPVCFRARFANRRLRFRLSLSKRQ